MLPSRLLLSVVTLFILFSILFLFPLPTHKLIDDQPQFEPGDCWFANESAAVECGWVRVPEDRGQSITDDNSVNLAVVVFHTASERPLPDPLIFLTGGPGTSAINPVAELLAAELQNQAAESADETDAYAPLTNGLLSVLQNRDVVIFDQRGTGYSVPSLDCPENDPADCHRRLVDSGVNLAAYNTVENAADVADVRRGLGYETANLIGASYGTRLALTVMRHDPEHVRSMVLDSPVPPQIPLDVEFVQYYQRSLETLFAACATDEVCSVHYPALDEVFHEVVNQLNTAPASVDVGGRTIWVAGYDFSNLIWQSLSYGEAIPYLPKLISDTYGGDTGVLTAFLERLAGNLDNMSEGMYLAVECSGTVAFESPQAVVDAAAGLNPIIAQGLIQQNQSLFNRCQLWDVPALDASEHEPVVSDIPTLVLAGQFDPVTSLGWPEATVATLSNSYLLQLPGQGHSVIRSSACAWSIIGAFLDMPTITPNSACIEEAIPTAFVYENS